jgi:hypothetical protein
MTRHAATSAVVCVGDAQRTAVIALKVIFENGRLMDFASSRLTVMGTVL